MFMLHLNELVEYCRIDCARCICNYNRIYIKCVVYWTSQWDSANNNNKKMLRTTLLVYPITFANIAIIALCYIFTVLLHCVPSVLQLNDAILQYYLLVLANENSCISFRTYISVFKSWLQSEPKLPFGIHMPAIRRIVRYACTQNQQKHSFSLKIASIKYKKVTPIASYRFQINRKTKMQLQVICNKQTQ